MNHDLFNQPAIEARDKAIAQVSQGSPTWIEQAHENIRTYPHPIATGEDLRVWLTERIGEPHHHNVYGAMIMGAARKGLITKTGEYRPMKLKQSHARVNPVYSITPQRP